MTVKVLVADDDELARRCFVDMLAALGASALEARSGAEALSVLAREAVDLVLADLRMPGPSGAELAHEVRARIAGAPRLVATSGELEPGLRRELLGAGYADALRKPVAQATLAALVRLDPAAAARKGAKPVARPPHGEADVAARGLDPSALAVLDDSAALAALGSEATVAALRGLMLKDLPDQRATLREDLEVGRRDAAVALLHRLRAASGFCGTPRFGEATADLQHALERGLEGIEALQQRWEQAAREVEAALAQR